MLRPACHSRRQCAAKPAVATSRGTPRWRSSSPITIRRSPGTSTTSTSSRSSRPAAASTRAITGSFRSRLGPWSSFRPGSDTSTAAARTSVVYNCLFRADLDEAELMWAFRDGHLRMLFNPDGLSRAGSRRPPVAVQLDDQGLANVLAALEPITREQPRCADAGPASSAHLLLALDVVATASHDAARGPCGTTPPGGRRGGDGVDRGRHHASLDARGVERRRPMSAPRTSRARSRSASGCRRCTICRDFGRNARPSCSTRTDDAVASIGAAVGWPDPAYFSRRFRAVFGVSPREYRHRHQRGRRGRAARPDRPARLARRSAKASKNRSRKGKFADRAGPMLAARTRLNAFLAVCRLAAYAIRGGGASMRHSARTRLGVLTIFAALAIAACSAVSAVQPSRLRRRRVLRRRPHPKPRRRAPSRTSR